MRKRRISSSPASLTRCFFPSCLSARSKHTALVLLHISHNSTPFLMAPIMKTCSLKADICGFVYVPEVEPIQFLQCNPTIIHEIVSSFACPATKCVFAYPESMETKSSNLAVVLTWPLLLRPDTGAARKDCRRLRGRSAAGWQGPRHVALRSYAARRYYRPCQPVLHQHHPPPVQLGSAKVLL